MVARCVHEKLSTKIIFSSIALCQAPKNCFARYTPWNIQHQHISVSISTLIGCAGPSPCGFAWTVKLFQLEHQAWASGIEGFSLKTLAARCSLRQRFNADTQRHEAWWSINLRLPMDFDYNLDTRKICDAFRVNAALSWTGTYRKHVQFPFHHLCYPILEEVYESLLLALTHRADWDPQP